MPTESYRDESRKNFANNSSNTPTIKEVALGCMQRIADATEAMAKSHTDLIREKERYRQRCTTLEHDIATLKKQVARYKGLYNKEKNKIPQ